MQSFLDCWAPELAPMVSIISYESLRRKKSLPSATYIFSDIERLLPEQLPALDIIYSALQNQQAGKRLLNHPSRSMKRYDLLKTLYANGYNPHNIYRIDEIPRDLSFPVFIRGENDHKGSLTGLIYNHNELASALNQLRSHRTKDKVVLEFCDTSDSRGIYRKYSAYIVADSIIPQHMMFSAKWHMKGVRDLALRKEDLYEERIYIRDNPHEHELREICRLANISYGRLDYSVMDGKPVVWEINTNPTLMGRRGNMPKCCVTRSPFVQKLIEVFREIDCAAGLPALAAPPVARDGAVALACRASSFVDDHLFHLRKFRLPQMRERRKAVLRDLKKKLKRAWRQ
jgi:hypothetical protein